jgi:hypothetical protein
MEALRAERDAALEALDRAKQEAEEQVRLLVEEQDRFVSSVLTAHEREIRRLELELEEARAARALFEKKLERERQNSTRLEEQLLRARAEMDRRRPEQATPSLENTIRKLQAELALAHSMLDDAMGGARGGSFTSARPNPGTHEVSRPPRESGIVNRRIPRPRQSTPPGVQRVRRSDTPTGSQRPRRSETPRAAAGGDEPPPSSR